MTKTIILKMCMLSLLLLPSMSCNPVGDSNTSHEATASPVPVQPSSAPTQKGESTPMLASSQTPATGPENLVAKAIEDLAQRLSVATTQIKVDEITQVEWSDSSLGCPQPDMFYLQVITPGYRIVLEANGTQYEYHSNREAYVIYCENANPSILPKP